MDWWPVFAFGVVQTVAIVWWAATTQARVVELERDVEKLDGVGERMAKIETALDNIQTTLDHVSARLGAGRNHR